MRPLETLAIRKRGDCTWRDWAFVAALIAVTFNLLQPLGHAVSMRYGAPGPLGAVFCKAVITDFDLTAAGGVPGPAAEEHGCCLGLAHAPFMAAPPTDFTTLPPLQTLLAPALPIEQRPAVSIRDGPNRPRAPPSFS